jgi:Tol biopolymer transport system component
LEGGGWSPLAWSPDERRILLQEYVSINEASLWVVDSDSGAKALATPTNTAEKVAYGYADFSRDGKGFYVITDAGSEFRRLAYFDLTTRQMRFLSGNLRGDVDEFDLSADRTKIAFVTNEEGTSRLYLLDL